MQLQLAFGEKIANIGSHAFANTRDGQQCLVVLPDLSKLLIEALNGFSGAAVGAYTERIVTSHLHQVSGFIEDVGNGFVVHG